MPKTMESKAIRALAREIDNCKQYDLEATNKWIENQKKLNNENSKLFFGIFNTENLLESKFVRIINVLRNAHSIDDITDIEKHFSDIFGSLPKINFVTFSQYNDDQIITFFEENFIPKDFDENSAISMDEVPKKFAHKLFADDPAKYLYNFLILNYLARAYVKTKFSDGKYTKPIKSYITGISLKVLSYLRKEIEETRRSIDYAINSKPISLTEADRILIRKEKFNLIFGSTHHRTIKMNDSSTNDMALVNKSLLIGEDVNVFIVPDAQYEVVNQWLIEHNLSSQISLLNESDFKQRKNYEIDDEKEKEK
ncbi:hypothetical protein ROZALSC1DRAFT_27527 [Rozella allomycis CSF55]|uniref:Uncharacterized protein n=1 Tax=Rozella allomycis (strain CSF55) TaxID=988480 RepID=A0A075B2I1_ROZAC|nr:hypothetical protein O9G_003204 [Rozella allomycis CSF55]RKP21028.1 hypothetical protein ROZALSC1DRAFT_27527 [Rozella allomycis CSF55]|eukprot:EPZ35018.1 hypothetical protein O9G_003204 [Rozella allomycis CSF55]